MRKRRIDFYVHLKRVNVNRLTWKIFIVFYNKPKTQVKLFKKVKSDLADMGIREEDITNRYLIRDNIEQVVGFERKKRSWKSSGDRRKKQHSEGMKKREWMH